MALNIDGDAVKSIATIGALCVVFGAGVKGCYDSSQHDRRIEAGFREAVMTDPSPHMMTVRTDDVTRQGYLNRGAAVNFNDKASTLIVAESPEAACWYTTLRVTEGQTELPFLQKIGGGEESEEMFANQAFHNGSYSCVPLPGQPTINSGAKLAP